jgi:hypothetical protein
MPTATSTAERSLSAHGEPHRILSMDDLHDPKRFKTIRDVPILDRHSDPTKGVVDDAKLDLLAKNSNALNAQGDHPTLTIGHSRRKATIVVIRHDGSKVVLPGASEEEQPPIVGHLSHWHVAPFRGVPTLHASYHIANEHVERVKGYPHRSCERLEPQEDGGDDGEDERRHYIDRVSLLSTAPERQLGVTHYEQDICVDGSCPDRPLIRTVYERDFPPISYDDSSDPPPSAGADCPCNHSGSSTPTKVQYEETDMPEIPQAPPAAPPEPAPAPPPEAPPAEAPAAGTIGSMTMESFMAQLGPALQPMVHDAVMNSLMTLMPPEGAPGAEGEGQEGNEGEVPGAEAEGAEPDTEANRIQHEADDDTTEGGIPVAAQAEVAKATPTQMSKEAADDLGERKTYGASEPGSANVFIPGAAGAGASCGGGAPKKLNKEEQMERVQYQREVNDLKAALTAEKLARVKYESDLAETQEVILMLVEDRNGAQLYAKQTAAKEELLALVHDGWKVDIDKEVARITLDTPAEYLPERLEEIRTMHARSAANVRHTIPIGGVIPGGGKAAGLTKEQAYEAANYKVSHDCTMSEARAALGYG